MGFNLGSILGKVTDIFIDPVTDVLGGVGGALFGESPSAEISPKKTLTPEQEAALRDVLLPFLTGKGTGIQDAKGAEFGASESNIFTAPVGGAEASSLAALEQLAMAGVQPGAGQDFLSQLLSGSQDPGLSAFQGEPSGPLSQFIEGGQDPGQSTEFLTNLFTEGADAFQVGPGSALAQFFEPNAEDFDEFFTLAIEQPLLKSFEKDVLPAITRRSSGTGNLFGSATRQNIENAQETLISQLAQQRASLGFQTREAAQGRALSAATTAEQLEATGFESARGREVSAAETVSGQALSAAGQIETQGFESATQQFNAQLEAALEAEGLNLDRAGLQLKTITENIKAQGIPRDAQNLEIASQYADFLRKEGLQDVRINQLLAAIGLPTVENIATVTPGTTGLLQAFLGGGGLS